MQEWVNLYYFKLKECNHCWKPIIILGSLIYIRECQLCGLWSYRNRVDEGTEDDNKLLEEINNDLLELKKEVNTFEIKYRLIKYRF